MLVILLLLVIFVPAICTRSSLKIPNDVRIQKAIDPLVVGMIISAVISVTVGVYNFLQMRKQQKKNQQKPNQLDGTIADEGTSFSDIAGSPHMYGNITHIWGQKTTAIKSKGGKK